MSTRRIVTNGSNPIFLKETAPLEFKCQIILTEQAAGEIYFANMLSIGKWCCAAIFCVEVQG